jgi:hypothetical protein
MKANVNVAVIIINVLIRRQAYCVMFAAFTADL